jgi:hypothetical protein
VEAALEAHDFALADRLLVPVDAVLPAQRSPAVTAQRHRLQGLLAAARGEDPGLVESEMRLGIEALEAFGARAYRARAEAELARWLVSQDRYEEAEPLLASARATYVDMGALGWLAKLDDWRAGPGRPSIIPASAQV